MEWQSQYPQQDGVYWFWGGRTDHPSAAPQIVEVWGDVWHVIGEGTRRYADDFLGTVLDQCCHPRFPRRDNLSW